jgi:transposase/Tfp pilus assembly protein PilV
MVADEASEPKSDAERPKADPRLRRPDRQQFVMEMVCPDERIPADHPARTIWQVVEKLDLSAFYEPIEARGSDPGRAATDPKLLVALWLYAAVDGVGNGRKLDRLCQDHNAYRWLCGGVSVNYHTLNDFRVQHEQALDALMTQVLTALMEKGVVKVERISQDGKKVRASAGTSSFHRKETLARRLEEVRQYIEELKRQPEDASSVRQAARERAARERQERLQQALDLIPELEKMRQNPRNSKKDREKPVRVSSTDPEARKMKMPDGGVRPAYNAQLATDTSSGAIVGVDVVNSSADQNQSEPLREQVEQRMGQKVQEHLVDQGYVDMESIDRAEQSGTAIYAPLPESRKTGEPVTESRWDTEWTRRWRERMQTAQAKEIYKLRAMHSERVNAELVDRMGLHRVAVRGLRKVKCVMTWMALAFNVIHFSQHLVG